MSIGTTAEFEPDVTLMTNFYANDFNYVIDFNFAITHLFALTQRTCIGSNYCVYIGRALLVFAMVLKTSHKQFYMSIHKTKTN